MERQKLSFKLMPILLGLLSVIFVAWLQLTSIKPVRHWINQFNNFAYDMQLRAALFDEEIDKSIPVAIVDIDDKSLKEQGRWPWSRKKLADLIKHLYDSGATVVALDIIFPEPEKNIAITIRDFLQQQPKPDQNLIQAVTQLQPHFDYDQLLANSLALGDSVLGLTFHHDQQATQGVLPPPLLTLSASQLSDLNIIHRDFYTGNLALLQGAAKHGGFINAFPDNDGVIRHAQILLRYQDKVYPSLALEAAKQYLLVNSVKLATEKHGKRQALEGIYFDQQMIPTDAKGQVLIPFRGPQGSFTYLSATDVLQNKISSDAVKNKIIFVGSTAAGMGDIHATAVQSSYAGVEVHANIAAGVLKNHFPHRPAWASGAELSGLLLIGLIAALVFPYLGPGLLLVASILVSAILFHLNGWLWQQQGIVLSAVLPIVLVLVIAISNLAYGYLFEGRRREQLKSMFGQYVPSEHVEKMLLQKSDYGFLGENRELTMLFADIRNFTTISEHMDAAALKEMLNQFFTPMTQIIFNCRGTIDKYVGDMIMAFWGAPLEDPLHARHAIEAALAMQKAVHEMQAHFQSRYGIEVKIGIGINTGNVSVGDMGSEFRRAYTVLGDNVNLASRLEGLSKYYGVGIVAGENTRNQCIKDFIFRPLDKVKVKGKDIAVEVFEPICPLAQAADELLNELQQYQQALDFYYRQKWDGAAKILTALSNQFPETYVYKLYLKRINELKQTPPELNWDGVYVSKSK